MELGLNFGDVDFQSKAVKESEDDKATADLPYEPKQCPSKWFENVDTDNLEDQQVQIKYSGDLAFAAGDYEKACHQYLKCWDNLGSKKAASMRRDLTESLSRSYLQRKKLKEAEKWAKELVIFIFEFLYNHKLI